MRSKPLCTKLAAKLVEPKAVPTVRGGIQKGLDGQYTLYTPPPEPPNKLLSVLNDMPEYESLSAYPGVERPPARPEEVLLPYKPSVFQRNMPFSSHHRDLWNNRAHIQDKINNHGYKVPYDKMNPWESLLYDWSVNPGHKPGQSLVTFPGIPNQGTGKRDLNLGGATLGAVLAGMLFRKQIPAALLRSPRFGKQLLKGYKGLKHAGPIAAGVEVMDKGIRGVQQAGDAIDRYAALTGADAAEMRKGLFSDTETVAGKVVRNSKELKPLWNLRPQSTDPSWVRNYKQDTLLNALRPTYRQGGLGLASQFVQSLNPISILLKGNREMWPNALMKYPDGEKVPVSSVLPNERSRDALRTLVKDPKVTEYEISPYAADALRKATQDPKQFGNDLLTTLTNLGMDKEKAKTLVASTVKNYGPQDYSNIAAVLIQQALSDSKFIQSAAKIDKDLTMNNAKDFARALGTLQARSTLASGGSKALTGLDAVSRLGTPTPSLGTSEASVKLQDALAEHFEKYKTMKARGITTRFNAPGYYYHPLWHSVNLVGDKDKTSPGTSAHEYGHASHQHSYSPAQRLSMAGLGVANSLGAVAAPGSNLHRLAGLGHAVTHLPELRDETQASWEGYQALDEISRTHPDPEVRALAAVEKYRAFNGLATYYRSALNPAIQAQKMHKQRRELERAEQQQ